MKNLKTKTKWLSLAFLVALIPTLAVSKNYLQAWQMIVNTTLSVVGVPTNTGLDVVIPKLDKLGDQPLRLRQGVPADSKLYISGNKVTSGDDSQKSSGPAEGSMNTFVASSIDYQSGATTGGDIKVAGGSFALPACTVGQFRRHVLVYSSFSNWVDTAFSAQSATVGALTSAATTFETLDGVGMGYVDLECTNSAGQYKTVGSATNVIQSLVSGNTRIFNLAERVGTMAYQNRTNVDILGGEVANTTLTNNAVSDKLTFTNGSTPATPSAGNVSVYTKTDKKLYTIDESGTESAVGASGSGEVNVITNSSDSNNWAASGAGVTVATSTTSTDLPLQGVIATAIKITPVSGTDYARYRWKMPEALKNKKLKSEWHQRPLSGYASGDLKFDVYKHSDTGTCTYSGGSYTRYALSTDASAVTSIPNSTGKYTTTFDADNADCYELRVTRVAGTTALNLANFVVGPGIQPQGAVVGEWQSYTPVATNLGAGSISVIYAQYRRVGSAIEIQARVDKSGAGSGTTSVSLSIPSGLSINFTALGTGGNVSAVGSGMWFNAANYKSITPWVANSLAGTIQFKITYNFADQNIRGTDFASGDQIQFTATVPIAEWAGSGTVNLAQNDVEYAYTTGTWDAADDTTGYGPVGAVISGALTASRKKTITWQTPMQIGDVEVIEIQMGGVGPWVPMIGAADSGVVNIGIAPYNFAGTGTGANTYGVHLSRNASSVTQSLVEFGLSCTAYWDGSAWQKLGWDQLTSGSRWRVRKSSAGAAVGFGIVSETSSGLLPSTNTNLDNASATRLGLKQYLHGTTYNGGNAPTVTLTAGGGSLSSVTRAAFVPYQMQGGEWRMKINISATLSSTTRTTHTLSINGVTFKTGPIQIISGATNATNFVNTYAASGSAGIVSNYPSFTTDSSYISGDVELDSKPTWAY